MSLNIRIVSGNRQDEEFKLKAGLVIGRKNADLNIKDAKMSSTHAEIIDIEGKLFIVDKGSRNKILYEGQMLERLELSDGVSFQLGETKFLIFLNHEDASPKAKALELLDQVYSVTKNKPVKISPMPIKILMTVKSGPEKGLSLPIAYGPRSIGNANEDISLSECGPHKNLVELVVKNNMVYLTTKQPDFLLVNNGPAKTENLLDKDMNVRFANTHIIFEILK